MSLACYSGEIIREKYKIVSILGKGSLGITYKAIDLVTNNPVAIKVISLQQLEDWKQLELIEREVEVLKSLNHPAIPKYIDYFSLETETTKAFYIVQELVVGKSLFQLIESGWRVGEKQIKDIARQVLSILDYLHSLDPPIIHRDIKPSNLILNETGEVYLIDFGAVQNTYYNTLMQGSTVVGTYGYMSPEQFRGQTSPASDLYSLGATLLYLLTHRSPAELPQDTLKLDFRSYVNISESFANWLDKILEPDIEDRYQTTDIALSKLLNSKKQNKQKLFTSLSIGLLSISLFAGVAYYKLFFLSYLGFYPNDLCQLEVMKNFDKKGGNINFINIKSIKRDSKTMDCLLRTYLFARKLDIARLIINNGGNVNLKLANGRTYLFYFAHDLEVTKFLLEHNADPNIVDNLENTILFFTANHDLVIRKRATSYLGRSANFSVFFNIENPLSSEYYQVAKLLIEKGVDVNARNNLGETALFAAVRQKDIRLVKLLLENNVNVNLKNKDGKTAIYKAHPEIVKLLIKNGASLDLQDSWIKNLSYDAIRSNNIDLIQELINLNTGKDIRSKWLSNVLIRAIHLNKKEIVELLIENGANVDRVERTKYFPLVEAANKNIDIFKLLLEHGADINAKNDRGNSILFQAIDRRQFDLAKILIDNGANVNTKNERGQTPLSLAILKGEVPLSLPTAKRSQELIKLLVNNGADTRVLNYEYVYKAHDLDKNNHFVKEIINMNIKSFLDAHKFSTPKAN